jgi:hypothetical protein
LYSIRRFSRALVTMVSWFSGDFAEHFSCVAEIPSNTSNEKHLTDLVARREMDPTLVLDTEMRNKAYICFSPLSDMLRIERLLLSVRAIMVVIACKELRRNTNSIHRRHTDA